MTPDMSDDTEPGFPNGEPPVRRRKKLMEPLILLAIVAGWFILQIWVLPKMGVRT
ncbi:hypothetical protein BH11PLA2_BH11PLA2_44480 [soil metagenome]